MQKRYSITLKNFLENKKFNNKSFFINANDELVLENDNKKVAMDTDRYIGIDNSVNLTYQYQICNKYALGITAEMISIPEFLIFGISVKRYF